MDDDARIRAIESVNVDRLAQVTNALGPGATPDEIVDEYQRLALADELARLRSIEKAARALLADSGSATTDRRLWDEFVAALAATPERLGFRDLLTIADAILTNYPPETIVCSHHPEADIGARTVAAIRDLIESARAATA